MGNWIEYKIDDLCEVGRGSSPRPITDERYFVDGNIPWIKIYETKEHVNEFGASFSRYLEPNSLIIAASGVSLGQIKFLGVKGCIHDGWLYVSNYKTDIVSKEYLYYFLIYYSQAFHNYSSGAAIQNINTDILRNTKLKLPPLPIQTKISSILSSYDELIENNKQRIKLLEEMVEEIYKEWFVRLRFPGYETAKFVDGLPEGWGKVKISNAFDILGGGTPSTEINEFWEGGLINWFSPTDITGSKSIFLNDSAKHITEVGLKNSSAKLFPEKSVMMTSRATIGAIGINMTKACTNQGFITCIPNDHFPFQYIFQWIKNNRDLIESYSTGATFKEIARGVFNPNTW
jgi:type I restriction enzyme S subunit